MIESVGRVWPSHNFLIWTFYFLRHLLYESHIIVAHLIWGFDYGYLLQMNGTLVDLTSQAAPALDQSRSVEVELELGPIGAIGVVRSEEDLLCMVRSVATTLKTVHSVGLVHRDVRWDNILKHGGPNDWLLIDWELAGFVGEKVWWQGKALPPFARRGQVYDVQGDLWQLGCMVHGHTWAGPEAEAIAGRMMEGGFADAEAVLSDVVLSKLSR